MNESANETGFYRILVAVETDATRYYGADAIRPEVLDSLDAEQLLSHIAADLTGLLPGISGCSLITAGALFDQTQLMRPAFPVFQALEDVSISDRADRFRAKLVSIGATDGAMPASALQPLEHIPLGMLQLLPVVVHGPADLVAELGQAMEYRFLEEGQLSAHSAAWMQTAFKVEIAHARLMTLTDLNAMLRLQLDHFGFLPMWELLDTALNGTPERLSVSGSGGQQFEWRDGAIHTRFESFDYWASEGGGSHLPAARQELAQGYAEWTRELRQYITTLSTHGLDFHFHLPDNPEPLKGNWFEESSRQPAGDLAAAITEHSFDDLGTIAITAVIDGEVKNYYPLVPQGLNDVHRHLRSCIPEKHTVAFPGTLLYDEGRRCLVSDTYKPFPVN